MRFVTFSAPEIYTITQYFQDKIKLKLDEDVSGIEGIRSFIHSFIHQWLYSPLLGSGLFFQFRNLFLHRR
jgi:hypothetical protein